MKNLNTPNMPQSLFTSKVEMKYPKTHLILLNNNNLQDFLNRNGRANDCFTVNVRKKLSYGYAHDI